MDDQKINRKLHIWIIFVGIIMVFFIGVLIFYFRYLPKLDKKYNSNFSPQLIETFKENDKNIEENFPLAKFLPIVKDNYKIVYTAPLTVTVKYSGELPNPQMIFDLVKSTFTDNNISYKEHFIVYTKID